MRIITKEYEDFSNNVANEFVMRNMPSGDISMVKYFVPLFDGGIRGYYEVTGFSFGSRKKEVKDSDGNIVRVDMPCLNIKLGEYESLGSEVAPIPNYRNWNGQIHSYSEVMEIYQKKI